MNISQSSGSDFALSQDLDFVKQALSAAAAIDAAYRLGVLARLQREPGDALTIARDCEIHERGAYTLLAVLAGLGLLKTDEAGTYYAATPNLVAVGDLQAYLHPLADVVKYNRSIHAGDTSYGAQTFYPTIVSGLADLMAGHAQRFADYLSRPGLRVLDVGAGGAPWSRALASRDPKCHVTAADLPAVLATTRRAVSSAGLNLQFDYLAGDVFESDLGADTYDIVIAGNFCHLFDADTNRRFLRRLWPALRRGGILAIVDSLLGERLDSPLPVALYGLGLLLRTDSGRVYPFSAFAGWLEEAGCVGIERFELSDSGDLSLITARRP